MTRWQDRAPCREVDTAVFFPARGDTFGIVVAKELCRTCPVRGECLAYVLELSNHEGYEIIGIWAGTTVQERRRLRGRRLVGEAPTACSGERTSVPVPYTD